MRRYLSRTSIFLFLTLLLVLLISSCGGSANTPSISDTTPETASEPAVSNPTEPVATEVPPTETMPAEPSGMSPGSPLSITKPAITPDWEITVVEVLRGDEALAMLKQVSASNDAPDDGMEYLLANVHVKYVGTNPSAYVYEKIFRGLGSANEMYKSLSFVKIEVPEPALDADLAPGEETEGWVAFQVGTGETGLMLVVWPYVSYENNTGVFSDSSDKWYIALE
jgi:hypothetical protein